MYGSSGQPLNDQDRYPWLVRLGKNMSEWAMRKGAIIACSALKESYREILSSESKESITWIHLFGTETLIERRMEAREGHFMNPNLVKSQFEALEIPEYGLHIDVSNDIETIISTIISNIEKLSIVG